MTQKMRISIGPNYEIMAKDTCTMVNIMGKMPPGNNVMPRLSMLYTKDRKETIETTEIDELCGIIYHINNPWNSAWWVAEYTSIMILN